MEPRFGQAGRHVHIENQSRQWRLLLPAGLLLAQWAAAGPTDGVVRGGAATISQTPTTTTITQTTDRAVIDWRSFNIAADESVTFLQPNSQSAVLNRVTGTQFSSLQGSLTANGQVFLVNPNGILIGSGASDQCRLVRREHREHRDAAFMRDAATATGRYAFDELASGAGTATIVNAGNITVAEGGMVALVAPGVRNSGDDHRAARAPSSSRRPRISRWICLATISCGSRSEIRCAGSLVDSAGTALTAQVGAGGTAAADGGRIVLLTVPAAAGVVSEAINLSGIARASSVGVNQRGEISLLANQGSVVVSGTADVTSTAAGARVVRFPWSATPCGSRVPRA